MERLILARHGESTYSARGLVNGDPALDVGLTIRGEEEARALGRALAGEPLEVCVVTALPRTRATAELALAGRDVPIEVVPELSDPQAGRFEGGGLAEYRTWAWSHGSRDEPPGGGESRRTIVARYADAYHALVERPEPTILAVLHALPIAYVLLALDGVPPPPRVDVRVEHARPHPLTAAELRRALGVLDAWCEEPTW
jgi:broad specificity phosphatase PhoE